MGGGILVESPTLTRGVPHPRGEGWHRLSPAQVRDLSKVRLAEWLDLVLENSLA